jgi:hypothetical protein
MARKETPAAVSEYLAEIGRRGGEKTGRKGLAAMPPEQREAIQAKAAAARRKQAKKAGKSPKAGPSTKG